MTDKPYGSSVHHLVIFGAFLALMGCEDSNGGSVGGDVLLSFDASMDGTTNGDVLDLDSSRPDPDGSSSDSQVESDAIAPSDDASLAMDSQVTDVAVIPEPPCGEASEEPSCRGVNFLPCESREGTNRASLLVGTVLLPDDVICNGEVLIDGDSGRIECVGESCRQHPLAPGAAIVCGDVISPGLIDPHNHMSFNTLPPWRHGERLFQNRDEWRSLIGREMYGARPNRGDPLAARYSELRLLLAGTTSVHKAENVTASHDHVRNIDRGPNGHGLGYSDAAVQECVFPLTQGCSAKPDYAREDSIPARRYLAHVSEGIDNASRSEFERFMDEGQLGDKTTIIHCVSCGGPEMSAMKALDTSLVWSPSPTSIYTVQPPTFQRL